MTKKERGLGKSVMAVFFTVILFTVSAMSLFAQSELEGTWTLTNHNAPAATTFVFSGENFIYKERGVVLVQGTYTITTSRNTSTLNLTGTNGETLRTTYTIKDGVFNIPRQPTIRNWSSISWGDFNKVIPQNNIEGTWTHPFPDARGATYVFAGNRFTYTRNDNVNITGTAQMIGNKLFLIVDGNIVMECVVVFYENESGSTMTLFYVAGLGQTYYIGPYRKQ